MARRLVRREISFLYTSFILVCVWAQHQPKQTPKVSQSHKKRDKGNIRGLENNWFENHCDTHPHSVPNHFELCVQRVVFGIYHDRHRVQDISQFCPQQGGENERILDRKEVGNPGGGGRNRSSACFYVPFPIFSFVDQSPSIRRSSPARGGGGRKEKKQFHSSAEFPKPSSSSLFP